MMSEEQKNVDQENTEQPTPIKENIPQAPTPQTNNGQSNAGQGLGIAGLVIGIIALIISFIPCLGMYALVPGIIAVTLSAIGYAQANKGNGSKGIIIAALIVSLIGTSIAGWQLYMLSNVANNYTNALEQFGEGMEEYAEEMESFEDEFENAMDDIEDDATLDNSSVEKIATGSELNKIIEEKDYDKLLDVYENTLDKYITVLEDAEKGNVLAIGKTMAAATKISVIAIKVATVIPLFNEKQLERFNEIDEKYNNKK